MINCREKLHPKGVLLEGVYGGVEISLAKYR